MKFNFRTICHSNLLRDLPARHKDVLSRRFGLRGEKETLEAVGRAYGITRERVRQIEKDSLNKLADRIDSPQYQKVFSSFAKELKTSGNLKREDILLAKLGGAKFQNHALFLLTLGKPFEKISETGDFYSFWTVDKNSFNTARKHISAFISELKRKQKPLSLPKKFSLSYIEISKDILKGPQGLYGLKNWPEIRPRGIRDKAYIVFKKEEKPLHFTQVARYIGRDALPQTVHNELIKDARFVLIGRGLYALQEWGYTPGVVRQVISDVFKSSKKLLSKDQVLREVLKQRQVKPNTVLLNLQNKKYFIKNSEGKYFIRKA